MQATKLFFSLTWILAGVMYSSSVLGQSYSRTSSDLPPPPDTGTIESDSSPGGSRTDKDSTCKKTNKPLTSLLAVGDLTLSEYPSFWFYIPYTSEEISTLEFELKDTAENKIIYQTAIAPIDQTGIIKVSLPSQAKYALSVQKNYAWNFSVRCDSKQPDKPDIALSGAVRRISKTSQLEKQLNSAKSEEYLVYINNYIYYDAVTYLASLYLANPDNSQLKTAWNKLLETIGRKELVGEPIINASLVKN